MALPGRSLPLERSHDAFIRSKSERRLATQKQTWLLILLLRTKGGERGFGSTEGWRTRFQIHRRQKTPVNHRRTFTHQLCQGNPVSAPYIESTTNRIYVVRDCHNLLISDFGNGWEL